MQAGCGFAFRTGAVVWCGKNDAVRCFQPYGGLFFWLCCCGIGWRF